MTLPLKVAEARVNVCRTCAHNKEWTCERLGLRLLQYVVGGGACPIGKFDRGGVWRHWLAGVWRLPAGLVLSVKNWRLVRARARVCRACDRYQGGRCTACGCVALAKAAWRGAVCPVGKWGTGDPSPKLSRQSVHAADSQKLSFDLILIEDPAGANIRDTVLQKLKRLGVGENF